MLLYQKYIFAGTGQTFQQKIEISICVQTMNKHRENVSMGPVCTILSKQEEGRMKRGGLVQLATMMLQTKYQINQT